MSKTDDRTKIDAMRLHAYTELRDDVIGWHDREIARLERDIAALHLRVRMTTADLVAARSAKDATMLYIRAADGIALSDGDKETT